MGGVPITPAVANKPSGTPGAQAHTDAQEETRYWDDAKSAGNKEAFEAYLGLYPRGRYAGLARANVVRLGASAASTTGSLIRAPGVVFRDCPECPEMVVIPSGRFTMGSNRAEKDAAIIYGNSGRVISFESPEHRVSIRSFSAGRYAITKGEFAAFVNAKGYRTEAERGDGCLIRDGEVLKKEAANNWRSAGFAQGSDHPVVCVSWNDAQAYVQWLSQTTGQTYRLPSEAEREYAARGGTQTAFWWGDSYDTTQANGKNFNGESRKATVAVNSFKSNPFGLYNVHGNIGEWVEDCWHDNYAGAPTDGSAWATSCIASTRVIRSLGWESYQTFFRSASRIFSPPNFSYYGFGFRVARAL